MEQTDEVQKVNQLKWAVRNPLEAVLCGLLTFIVIIAFIQVIFRYVFHTSLSWSEELARYMFLWFALLGAAYAFKSGSHFALRFVVDKFGKKAEGLFRVVVLVIVSLFLIVFIWKSIEYTFSMANQVAPSTGISMAVPYSSAIVGGGLMLYYVVMNFINSLKNTNPEELSQES